MGQVSGRLMIAAFSAAAIWFSAVGVHADGMEKAYALNQDAMVDMSMAQFKSAAEKFIQAANLVPDYQIKDQKLGYTPTFMAAWSYEKIGNVSEACRYFRRFLEIITLEEREPTKSEHAEDYLIHHCGL